jgi:hypothetical protein
MRLRYGSGLLLIGTLWGCASMTGTTSSGSVPLFQADATDTVIIQGAQREQETLLNTCARRQSCDQVHFTRAMLALFQNRQVAAASFQEAIAVAPNGPLADSSARWIRLLDTFHHNTVDEPNGALLEVMKELVRTWLEQQPGIGAAALRAVEGGRSPEPAHTLQRRIRDRDKKIAELTDQLSALKQIDLDTKGNSKLTLRKIPTK